MIKHIEKQPTWPVPILLIIRRPERIFLLLLLLSTLMLFIYIIFRAPEPIDKSLPFNTEQYVQKVLQIPNISPEDVYSDINTDEIRNVAEKPQIPKSNMKTQERISKQVHPNYYEDNLRLNWTFNISKNYDDRYLRDWSEPHRVTKKSTKWTHGENGTAFIPSNNDEKTEMEKLKNEHKFNIYASDRISLHRSLPDYRFPECRSLTYPEKLPTVSIIIVFHNEAWSTLLRTIWSIIDRSPMELVEEIILVDDASTMPLLQRPLNDYIELIQAKIRIIRSNKREGLIRSRLIGARNATGNILMFLDAHMECTEGWLHPILARVANDRSVVAVPKIDGISSKDMSYSAPSFMEINTLRLNALTFHWMLVPKRENERTKYDKTAPVRTPTHVGCAFAIDREFFFEIGSYDEQMDIWGSENVEMAFRVWMCGGSLEILPCSRIGHMYRISTYSYDGNKEQIEARNNVRLVEVWMDEFKDIFYAANPKLENISAGDLADRKNLRERLNCKSFRWFLENIYPESNMLKEYILMGEVRSISKNMCLDTYTGLNGNLMLYECHGAGGNQFMAFEKSGHLLTINEYCVGANDKSVILVHCSESNKSQLWNYDNEKHWIIHRKTKLCMHNNENTVTLGACNLTDTRFQWEIKSQFPKALSKV